MAGTLQLRKIDERDKISLKDNTSYHGETYIIGDYEVNHYITIYEDGTVYDSVAVSKEYGLRFLPDISFEQDHYGVPERKFLISTTSYGYLDPDEIQEVMEGYKQALEVVEILTQKFCR